MLYFANWKVILICAVCAAGVLLSHPQPVHRTAARRRCRAGCRTSRWRSVSTCAAARICCSRSMSPRPSASVSTRSRRPCATRCATPRSAIPGSPIRATRSTFTIRDPGQIAAARQALAQARHRPRRRDRRRRGRHDPLPAGRDSTRAAGRPSTQSIEIIRRRIDETGTKEPTIQRQGQDRILVQLPGVDNPEHVKALLGRTAKLTFQLVDTSVNMEEARRGRLPPGDEILPAQEERGGAGPTAVCRAQARHGRRRHAGRCAGHVPRQRAGRQLQVRYDRRPPFRRRDARECRQAVRDRARQQGDQRAGHPRADPRRQRHHLGQLHGAVGQRPGAAAARRRLAGADHDSRGAHGRARSSAPIRSTPERSRASSR